MDGDCGDVCVVVVEYWCGDVDDFCDEFFVVDCDVFVCGVVEFGFE